MLYKKFQINRSPKITFRNFGNPRKNYDAETVANIIDAHEKKKDKRIKD